MTLVRDVACALTPSAEFVDAAAAQRRRAGGDHSLAAVILGNDALVAARPATPAQLANACIAAGFDLVVPPAWGDELVATGYLERLAGRREPVIVACACPRVAALVAHTGTSLPALGLAAPPVAVARALRAVHGEAILITYVGACPSASDPSIDVRFSPSALFAQLDRQEVTIAEQPTELGGAQVDRWRRYASVPGGLPALRFLARPPVDRVLRTLDAASFERGEMPPSRSDVLVDLAGAVQCACGGARDEIEEGEPRRSTTPVVQCPLGLPLDPGPTPPRRRAVFLRGPTRVDSAGGTGPDSEAPPDDAAKSGSSMVERCTTREARWQRSARRLLARRRMAATRSTLEVCQQAGRSRTLARGAPIAVRRREDRRVATPGRRGKVHESPTRRSPYIRWRLQEALLRRGGGACWRSCRRSCSCSLGR